MLQNTLKQLKKKDRMKLLRQLSTDLPTGCNVSTRNPAITSEMLKRITYIRMNADKLNPAELNEALLMLGFPMIDSWNPTIIDEQRRLICSYLNEKTATGNPITLNIIGNLTPEVTELKVTMNPIQDLSHGDPSPTNICPISGRDSVTVTRTAGEDVETHTHTYASTVYGGVDDFAEATLKITYGFVDLGTLSWIKDTTTVPNKLFFRAQLSNAKNGFNAICSNYPYKGSYSNIVDKSCGYILNTRIAIMDTTYDSYTEEQFATAMSGVQLCYELATPTQITNTPEDITLLKGENVLSTDGESINLKYKLSLT